MQGTLDKIKSIQSSPLIPFLVPLIIITSIIIGMYVKLGDKGHILNLLILSSIASGIILVINGPQMNVIIPLLFIYKQDSSNIASALNDKE